MGNRHLQITLRILKGLIEKSPKDLPLMAESVLNILEMVLRSKDLTTVEDSIATFRSFCEHHDGPSLAASQDYSRHFEAVVGMYAALASNSVSVGKESVSAPVSLRWRTVSLQAMGCIASSEALSLNGGRPLGTVIPVILENLHSGDGDLLHRLEYRARSDEQAEIERAGMRRMSNVTVQTADTVGVELSASRTTADADEMAEEKIGLLALQCLREIFTASSRGLVRSSTAAVLRFLLGKESTPLEKMDDSIYAQWPGTWAPALMEMITRWTPVQDRFLIMMTVMETLVKRPVADDDLLRRLTLVALIDCLLRSHANLIGLSVMDVLLDLLQQILLVLELQKLSSIVHLPSNHIHTAGRHKVRTGFLKRALSNGKESGIAARSGFAAHPLARQELLSRLRRCISDLATHIYYSDQISDLLTAILLRLKPSSSFEAGTVTGKAEDSANVTQSTPAENQQSTDFSSSAAKVVALVAIKEVLLVANTVEPGKAATVTSRNRVGLDVWEDTQWLLRDPEWDVRKAYVDALLTWLRCEVRKRDLQTWEERITTTKPATRLKREIISGNMHALHGTPTLSQRHSLKPAQPRYLTFLHLVMYEVVMEPVESESDVELVFLLLTSLVDGLGVTAAKIGIPMVFRLQEEIPGVESPLAKVRLGSIVHGYLWHLSQRFGFDSTDIGREVQEEMVRRKDKGMWMKRIQVPGIVLEQISPPGFVSAPVAETVEQATMRSEALTPFDHREAMVDLIVDAYGASLASPPGSPPGSPVRRFSVPILSVVDTAPATSADQVTSDVRKEMLSEWNKEVIIADCLKHSSNSGSVSGSRRGVNFSVGRQFLAVNGINGTVGGNGTHTLHRHLDHHQQRQDAPSPTTGQGAIGNGGLGLGTIQKLRQVSLREGGTSTPMSNSSRTSVVRVDELKRVLSGDMGRLSRRSRREFLSASGSSSSESLMSAKVSASNVSYDERGRGGGIDTTDFAMTMKERGKSRSVSRTRDEAAEQAAVMPDAEEATTTTRNTHLLHAHAHAHAHHTPLQPENESAAGNDVSIGRSKRHEVDLSLLLDRIQPGDDGEGGEGRDDESGAAKGIGRPPY